MERVGQVLSRERRVLDLRRERSSRSVRQSRPSRGEQRGLVVPLPAVERVRCEECHDLGWYRVQVAGGAEWQTTLVRCRCQAHGDARIAWERARRASDMSESLYTCTFRNFDGKHDAAAAAAVEEWALGGGSTPWLVQWGEPGNGKTHLLAAAFNAMVDADRLGASSGRLPLYVVVPALLDHIREGVQAGDYSGRFAAVALCPVLLLDDLGAEKRSEWSDEALFKLLDHRYRHGLRTAVATNLAPDELEPRIASRLQDRAVSWVYGMRGPDYRRSDVRAAVSPAGSGRAS